MNADSHFSLPTVDPTQWVDVVTTSEMSQVFADKIGASVLQVSEVEGVLHLYCASHATSLLGPNEPWMRKRFEKRARTHNRNWHPWLAAS